LAVDALVSIRIDSGELSENIVNESQQRASRLQVDTSVCRLLRNHFDSLTTLNDTILSLTKTNRLHSKATPVLLSSQSSKDASKHKSATALKRLRAVISHTKIKQIVKKMDMNAVSKICRKIRENRESAGGKVFLYAGDTIISMTSSELTQHDAKNAIRQYDKIVSKTFDTCIEKAFQFIGTMWTFVRAEGGETVTDEDKICGWIHGEGQQGERIPRRHRTEKGAEYNNV
jgi:hypothetical protein